MNAVKKSSLAAAIAAATMLVGMPMTPANAQMKTLHKHSMAAGIGAGLIAHHMAKKGARSRMASGRRPNFAERHPIMSGMAAGAMTHHMLKKH